MSLFGSFCFTHPVNKLFLEHWAPLVGDSTAHSTAYTHGCGGSGHALCPADGLCVADTGACNWQHPCWSAPFQCVLQDRTQPLARYLETGPRYSVTPRGVPQWALSFGEAQGTKLTQG